ncbi:peptidase U32 [Archaeoglobales archaeon]|mgnify:CR=1 FL=1|nr:MAG: peptidase U32 [Archaeoglobales archaeon]
MQKVSPEIDDEVIYVGLKGFSRYSDDNALNLDEIKELCENKRVFLALNRVVEFEKIKEIVEKLDCNGFIINDLGTIWRIKRDNKLKHKVITSSVGLNPLNTQDIQFFEEIGVDFVVIPPEINCEIDKIKNKTKKIKIEAFEFVLMEMFYKGRCLLSAYFDGVSTKKSGICTKRCCEKWDVIVNNKTIKSKLFNPKAVKFVENTKADLLKIEGRQFRRYANGVSNKHTNA